MEWETSSHFEMNQTVKNHKTEEKKKGDDGHSTIAPQTLIAIFL
jgi:hypothetical protein